MARLTIAHKIIVALLAAVILTLVFAGYTSVQRERELFDSDTAKDHAVFGRLIQQILVGLRAHCGAETLTRILEEADSEESHVSFLWNTLERPPDAAVPKWLDRHEAALLRGGNEAVRLGQDADGVPQVTTFLPVPIDDARTDVLSIREGLGAREDYVRRTEITLVAHLSILALVVIAVGWTSVNRLIGRPLGALVDLARRVGEGDLDARTEVARSDELGDLAAEMSRMCDRLKASRDAVLAQEAARLEAQLHLQHAERLATAGRLAAGVAHEIGTPLNVIGGHARAIETGECREGEAREAAQAIREQAARITRIVQDLLLFARRRPPERLPTDLRDVVTSTQRLLEPSSRRNSLTLVVEVGDRPLTVLADHSQMLQVMTNLVLNAIDASERPGEVRMRARAVQARSRACACLSVSDRGSGVPVENRERIFEPFFTTKDVGKGTGLGLSIAHGIVAAHEGWIEVESMAGEGTRFSVLIPLAEAECTPAS